MLDAPFNHTSYDAEFGYNGVPLFSPTSGAGYTSVIENVEARVFSLASNYARALRAPTDCRRRAGPRGFRQIRRRARHLFRHVLGAGGRLRPTTGNYLNEGDQFFGYLGSNALSQRRPGLEQRRFHRRSGVNNNITRNVWHYFASYVPYWLGQTGHGDGNGNPASNSTQRQPPRSGSPRTIAASTACARTSARDCRRNAGNTSSTWRVRYKWNFVFMTESLDGGAVTYRSNRHFDILNENIVFSFQNATTAQNYRDMFDARRSAYGQGLVLMNSTSHDEESYADPYQALIRYMVSGTIDGVPMIFYGQEIGISQNVRLRPLRGKLRQGDSALQGVQFTHARRQQREQRWLQQFLYPVSRRWGRRGQFSPALRSSNRYYLNQTGTAACSRAFSPWPNTRPPTPRPASATWCSAS